ncbi:hypothetical protein [Streptomyces hoynatensis]|uniref:Sensor domain-containing protein n=1 Tax=Streptomyces hoynatensis TaxID=1141874 RepID=A0A3A9ZFG1_9ACTN|nr:hypothetical protein [Streptomyces hoynatensis]RKN46949.1 hypothetical protein D7294_01755 [Streptomyces hoynatensis]
MHIRRSRAAILARAAGLAACCALAASGCEDGGRPGERHGRWDADGSETAWHHLGGGPLPTFRIELPAQWQVREGGAPGPETGCDAVAWHVLDRPEEEADATTLFTLYSLDLACPIDAETNESPINGRHAAFRSAGDVPQGPVATSVVDTALGQALAFTQTYTECTNSCRDFGEPAVLITLDAPTAQDHQALVLTSFRGESSESELTRLAREHLEIGAASGA